MRLYKDEVYSNTLLGFVGELDRILSQWEILEAHQKDGKPVKVPLIQFKKRKASGGNFNISKRQKMRSGNEDESACTHRSIDDLLDALKREEPPMTPGQPLDGEQIRSMIEYLRATKNATLEKKEALDDQIENDNNEHKELYEAVTRGQRKLEHLCVRRRNDYAREAIRRDYALGLKE